MFYNSGNTDFKFIQFLSGKPDTSEHPCVVCICCYSKLFLAEVPKVVGLYPGSIEICGYFYGAIVWMLNSMPNRLSIVLCNRASFLHFYQVKTAKKCKFHSYQDGTGGLQFGSWCVECT
jgi:hypothetical protein